MKKHISTPPKELGKLKKHLASGDEKTFLWFFILLLTVTAAIYIEVNSDMPVIWWFIPLWAIAMSISQILKSIRSARELTVFEDGLVIALQKETIDLHWSDVDSIRYDSLGLLLIDHGGQAIRPAFGLSSHDRQWAEQYIFEQVEPRIFEQLRSKLEDGQTIEIDQNLSISSQCLYIEGKAVPWDEIRAVRMKEVWGLMEIRTRRRVLSSVLFIYYYDTLHRMPMAPVRNAIIFKRLMDYYMYGTRGSRA